jgi:hypothetical protein
LLAVSVKLPPASAKAAKMRLLSAGSAPQPHSAPKVIVPRQSSEIFMPAGPKT